MKIFKEFVSEKVRIILQDVQDREQISDESINNLINEVIRCFPSYHQKEDFDIEEKNNIQELVDQVCFDFIIEHNQKRIMKLQLKYYIRTDLITDIEKVISKEKLDHLSRNN